MSLFVGLQVQHPLLFAVLLYRNVVLGVHFAVADVELMYFMDDMVLICCSKVNRISKFYGLSGIVEVNPATLICWGFRIFSLPLKYELHACLSPFLISFSLMWEERERIIVGQRMK